MRGDSVDWDYERRNDMWKTLKRLGLVVGFHLDDSGVYADSPVVYG